MRKWMYLIFILAFSAGILLLKYQGFNLDLDKNSQPVLVKVLNGCGKDGLAEKFTDFLRRKGLDVIDFGNAQSFNFPQTIVIDRVGSPRKAKRVARILGTENCIQQIKKDPYHIEEVLVIIGKDFRKLKIQEDIEG